MSVGGGRSKEAEGGGNEKVGAGRVKIRGEGGQGANGRRRQTRSTKEEQGERQRGERSKGEQPIAKLTTSHINF